MGGIKAHMDKEVALMKQDQIKVFKYKLPATKGLIRIVPIGDIHLGHRQCLVKKAGDFLNYVLKTPDTYTILMGDLIENVLPDTVAKHRGAMWEQEMTPEQQINKLREMLKPLAEEGKILFGVGGTHSLRSWYASGFEPELQLAAELKYPFSLSDALAEVQVGAKQKYLIHAVHGNGSTSDPAAVLRKLLAQPRRIADADIYLRGHHHSKVVATDYHFDCRTGKARKALYVGTGSFLGYIDTYAQRNSYLPAVPGAVKMKLYGERHDVHVTV